MKSTSKTLAATLALTLCMATASAQSYAPGEYEATAQGFGGEVKVQAQFDESKLTAITVTGDSETPSIGGTAMEKLQAAMLESSSCEVEAISGATSTSKAVLKAAAECFAQAKGETISTEKTAMTPGVYQGSAVGNVGTIHVEVEVTEEAIVSAKVTGVTPMDNPLVRETTWLRSFMDAANSELDFIIDSCKEEIPARIIANQSLAIDTVSGATASSKGIINAVANAIEQAGGNPDDFSAPMAKMDEAIEYSTDVLVIGAGTAGTAAAAAAKDTGAHVTVMEKSNRVGGTGVFSYMPFAIDSSVQKSLGIVGDAQKIYDDIMFQNHYYANGKVLSKFINDSGSTVDFLIDHGFDLTLPPDDGSSLRPSYEFVFYNGPAMSNTIQGFFDNLVKDVDVMLYETEAQQLLTDENGKVIGAVGERWDGTKVTVYADSVIVATGGYAGNPEMIKQYNEYAIEIKPYGMAQNDGLGLTMMLDVGAKADNKGGFAAHETDIYQNIGQGEFNTVDRSIGYTMAMTPTLLNVNVYGERFTDENERVDMLQSSANYYLANGGVWYVLMSQSQVDAAREQGIVGLGMDAAPYHCGFELQTWTPEDGAMTNIDGVFAALEKIGTVTSGASLEELAAKLGMNAETLRGTVARYNELCAAGYDADFHKDARYMIPLAEDEAYYAIKCVSLNYSTLGGVMADEDMRVLDENHEPIDGLYCAGVMTYGLIYDGVGYTCREGTALGWGFNSGKWAGMAAAQEALAK